jgi:hypothetical protein
MSSRRKGAFGPTRRLHYELTFPYGSSTYIHRRGQSHEQQLRTQETKRDTTGRDVHQETCEHTSALAYSAHKTYDTRG